MDWCIFHWGCAVCLRRFGEGNPRGNAGQFRASILVALDHAADFERRSRTVIGQSEPPPQTPPSLRGRGLRTISLFTDLGSGKMRFPTALLFDPIVKDRVADHGPDCLSLI